MTIRQYIDSVKRRPEEIAATRERDALVIAGDLLALIQLRIQTSGRNAQGAMFSPYSPGYAKQRQARGAQTRYVDFTVTGEMWRNTIPQVTQHSLASTTVEVSARTPANIAKMAAALTRPKSGPRGNLLTPSDDELQLVAQSNLTRLVGE